MLILTNMYLTCIGDVYVILNRIRFKGREGRMLILINMYSTCIEYVCVCVCVYV
jgi:hypothetical protein